MTIQLVFLVSKHVTFYGQGKGAENVRVLWRYPCSLLDRTTERKRREKRLHPCPIRPYFLLPFLSCTFRTDTDAKPTFLEESEKMKDTN